LPELATVGAGLSKNGSVTSTPVTEAAT
jgi:hypothetical protein